MNLVATPARKNPYVGPRSLQPDEPIYGRTAEINDLRSLLVSHRLVLLYSPSGAGKTSLIEAGLRAALHDRGFAVTPVIRVGAELSPDLAAPDANRYRASVIASLDERLPPEAQLNDLGRATISLEDYLVRLDEEAPDRNPCLIFDQFEELFTLDPADSEAKAEFIAELGDALRNRTRWALFAMREDFIGQLDEYVDALPTSLRTRFRLGLLGPDAAAKAALGPAHAAGVQFDDDEAHKLVEELRQIQVQRLGEARSEPGPSVEPVQLQLVCRDLWSKLGDGHAIHIPTGAAGAGVDGALATYYEEEIASLTKDKLVSEHELRQWVDSKLISVDGFRQPVTEAPGKSDLVLEHLEDAHLVRADLRAGRKWYELTHDRFVKPIRESNRDFRIKRTNKMARWGGLTAAAGLIIAAAILIPRFTGEEGLAISDLDQSGEFVDVDLDDTGVARYVFDAERADLIDVFVSAPPGTELDMRLGSFVDGKLEEVLAGGVQPGGGAVDAPVSAVSDIASDLKDSRGGGESLSSGPEELEISYPFVARGKFVLEVSSTADAELSIRSDVNAVASIRSLSQGSLTDVIDTSGEVRTYELMTDTADNTVAITLRVSDDFAAFVRMFDEAGNSVGTANATADSDGLLVTRLDTPGPHFVQVTGDAGSTGTFDINLDHPKLTDITLGLSGETISGTVSDTVASVFYQVVAKADEDVQVTVMPTDTFDPIIEVTGPAGFRRTQDSAIEGGAEFLIFRAPSDDVYTVVVRGYIDSTGQFDIDVGPAQITSLALDEVAPDSLDSSMSVRAFGFDAEIAQDLLVSVSPAYELDAIVEITGPDGFVEYVDAGAFGGTEAIVFAPRSTGLYQAIVTGYDGSLGDFSIRVSRAEPTRIASGESTTAEITGTIPAVLYELVGSPDEDLLIVVTPDGGLDPIVELRDPDGFFLDGADFSSDGVAEALLFTAPVDGVYRVQVTGFEGSTGGFEVTVQRSQLEMLRLGQTATGVIDESSLVATFEVDISEGADLALSLTSDGGFDAEIEVSGPGQFVDFADFSGPGQPERLEFSNLVNGRYRVTVRGFDGSQGEFELALTPFVPTLIYQSEAVSGSIDSQSPANFHWISANAGDGIDVLVDPNGELDPLVAVTGPDGFIDLAFTDAPGEPASLSFLAGTAGNYRVLVTSADGTTGGYELVYEVGR